MILKPKTSRFIAARGAEDFDDTLATTTLRAPAPASTPAAPAPQSMGRPAPKTVRMTGMSRTGF